MSRASAACGPRAAESLATILAAVPEHPDVTFLGSGTKTFGANASTTAFTIESGATVDISGRLLTFAGAYDNSLGGTLTTNGTSYIAFDTGSSALYANAWHHRSDAFSSVAVVFGFIAMKFGYTAIF